MGRPLLGASARTEHVQARISVSMKADIAAARGRMTESEWLYRVLRWALIQDTVANRRL